MAKAKLLTKEHAPNERNQNVMLWRRRLSFNSKSIVVYETFFGKTFKIIHPEIAKWTFVKRRIPTYCIEWPAPMNNPRQIFLYATSFKYPEGSLDEAERLKTAEAAQSKSNFAVSKLRDRGVHSESWILSRRTFKWQLFSTQCWNPQKQVSLTKRIVLERRFVCKIFRSARPMDFEPRIRRRREDPCWIRL